jgi:hypothetical protein
VQSAAEVGRGPGDRGGTHECDQLPPGAENVVGGGSPGRDVAGMSPENSTEYRAPIAPGLEARAGHAEGACGRGGGEEDSVSGGNSRAVRESAPG